MSVSLSAGVGRTGTIIALDVLLQQLEKERAVGINAFVHKMRLNRPHMVQTEVKLIILICIEENAGQSLPNFYRSKIDTWIQSGAKPDIKYAVAMCMLRLCVYRHIYILCDTLWLTLRLRLINIYSM